MSIAIAGSLGCRCTYGIAAVQATAQDVFTALCIAVVAIHIGPTRAVVAAVRFEALHELLGCMDIGLSRAFVGRGRRLLEQRWVAAERPSLVYAGSPQSRHTSARCARSRRRIRDVRRGLRCVRLRTVTISNGPTSQEGGIARQVVARK